VSTANQLAGIFGHIKDLTGTDRNLKLDPFELKSSMVVVGGQLVYNGSGPISLDRPLSAELYNIDLLAPAKKAGIQMTGILGEYQQQILDIMIKRRGAVIIEPADAPPAAES
jgi:poly(beta-D-mannuronate) C5 epimerase